MHFLTALKYTPGSDRILLRELRGTDELKIEGTGTLAAINLLDRLLVSKLDTPIKSANQLVVADRDRVLAALYKRLYGDQINSTIKCKQCASFFDLNFLLSALIIHLENETADIEIIKKENGIYKLENGICFRLPTGKDEIEIASLNVGQAEQKLLKNCVLDQKTPVDFEIVQSAMKQLAPVISTEMAAVCFECKHKHEVHFDMQSFLLTKLKSEQRIIAKEIHRLAGAYKWDYKVIKKLPRSQRKTFVQLIESELR